MELPSAIPCATNDCSGRIQAVCNNCQSFYCFNCSLEHAKKFSYHQLCQSDDQMKKINQNCHNLILQLKTYRIEAEKRKPQTQKEQNTKQYDQKLNPQKFQEQLNTINQMQKQTIKIVQKFYSELSLELVNIWQKYLEEFSNENIILDKIIDHIEKIEDFIGPYKEKTQTYSFIKTYFQEKFQKTVQDCKKMLTKEKSSIQSIPQCPQLQISQKLLISLSQLLCSQISTKNYQRIKTESKIKIEAEDTVHKNVKYIPIFPIKKKICYLYNPKQNQFQIQEFDQLNILPTFPKSILLSNGDLHIIGGANQKEQPMDTHIVFRSNTSQVFKLGPLPHPRNPVNSLVFKNKFIYIIGGLNENREWDRRCFSYSLEKKEWKQVSSMNSSKPHQSVSAFNQYIYCFGIPIPGKVNIQVYNSFQDSWRQVTIANFLSNPFNFASGFSAIQINNHEIIFFGGKKFLQNIKNKRRSTDRQINPYIYIFQPQNSSFYQLGALNPCIGVRDGQINPIIRDNSIYAVEYLISKNQPICRWLSSLHVLEITREGKVESIQLLHDD